ncbi:MAG: hypothetical protein ACWGQW_13940, partial [bacterium]
YSNTPRGRKNHAAAQFAGASAALPEFYANKMKHEMDLQLEAQKIANKGNLAVQKLRGKTDIDVKKMDVGFEREKLLEEKALVQELMKSDSTSDMGDLSELTQQVPGMFRTSGGKGGLLSDVGGLLSDTGIWKTGTGTYTNRPQPPGTSTGAPAGTRTTAVPPGFTPPRKPRATLTPYERYVGVPTAGTVGLATGLYGGYQKYVGQPFERLMKQLNQSMFPSYIE